MDGVMVDFDGAALVNVPKHLVVPRANFYVAHDYPDQLRSSIESTYNAPGFFESLKPMPQLHEGWQAMLDDGFYPQVCSAPLSSNETSVEGKRAWLMKCMVPEFGRRVVEEAIFDKNKWRHSAIALVDDRPDVPRGPGDDDIADWEHILFGWPHMADVPLANIAYRLLSWGDTEHLITTLNTISDQPAS